MDGISENHRILFGVSGKLTRSAVDKQANFHFQPLRQRIYSLSS